MVQEWMHHDMTATNDDGQTLTANTVDAIGNRIENAANHGPAPGAQRIERKQMGDRLAHMVLTLLA